MQHFPLVILFKLSHFKLTFSGFHVLGSQSASEGHRPSSQPACTERAPCAGAGAQRPVDEAAAGAAAEAPASGKSAETTSGDRDAAKDAQSQGVTHTEGTWLRTFNLVRHV